MTRPSSARRAPLVLAGLLAASSFALAAACATAGPAASPAPPGPASLAVFFGGDGLGELEPCG